MEKQKLLIAQSSEEFCRAITDILRGKFRLCCCADGYEAQRKLSDFQPDLMILDVMLPGIDGLSLLQRAREQGDRSRVLLLTCFDSDYVMEAAGRLGVGYVMRKPCDLGALVSRVEDLARSLTPAPMVAEMPENQVSGLLLALGLRPKLRGYACLREAVLLSIREEHQSVTKILYPEVAKRCGCRSAHVERNIRSAIDSAWNCRDENIWRMYFTPDGSGRIARPSNAAFISRLADSIRTEKVG